ncbi:MULTISPECIES: tyrosine-type recombinase/integrase [Pseudomonas]|uniref:Integrase arm-type DNA-binding domain-containing protein n=1 Tax=Pseudomonas nitroreducens TaxID=46680 RepID=A0A6G6J6Z1_PSENT|nr:MULTISPECIES: site-specific integrase [Pseudomonas]QIE91186.1 integrase arm-type DNA-binding domain-containing protein [Pseudomonas nitroreducens]UCL90242.1 integrase arm-type DNA-binding domain-containing protein [Pseudomonas sp. HS-18]
MSKLTAAFVKDQTSPGSYGDGRGLILKIRQNGTKTWIFRYSFGGDRVDLTIGAFPNVGLKEARLAADQYRLQIAKGTNPQAEKRQQRLQAEEANRNRVTFEDEAGRYIATHAQAWSKKHRQQWENSLAEYVLPVIGTMRPADVDTEGVLEVLEPIWMKIPVTARRVRNRIELVLDAAKARKLRDGENPARWRGHLDKLLPKQIRTSVPFLAATPLEARASLSQLDGIDGPAARAAELVILSVLRNGEVCGAQWAEFDFETRIWTIPPERMKNNRTHRVPITDRMLEVINQVVGKHTVWLFPNARGKGPLPSNAIGRALTKLKAPKGVPHGFRSTFRTWAAEDTSVPREVCEMALAHRVAGKVEAAYNRSDFLEKRRSLMDMWHSFLSGDAGSFQLEDSSIPSQTNPSP